jgi:hypothetical protein
MIKYDKQKYDKLKNKFPGSENIDFNYAQAYQDMFVLSCLNGKRDGYYLEIGAYHSTNLSNTYLLESKFGWSGISVDIDDSVRNSFSTNREGNLIIADAISLDYKKILNDYNMPKRIDYLQLDIEPQTNTLECLKNIPFDEYRFSVITYETDFYDPSFAREESLANREKSREILKSHGYFLLVGNVCNISENDPFEDWYIDPQVIDPNNLSWISPSEEYNMVSESVLVNF